MKKNYSHSKHYASGGKWAHPVIVPEYKESKGNDIAVWIVMIAILASLAVFILWAM